MLLAVGLLMLSVRWLEAYQNKIAEANLRVIRFGFSRSVLEDVNPTDALAASKVWTETVGVSKGA